MPHRLPQPGQGHREDAAYLLARRDHPSVRVAGGPRSGPAPSARSGKGRAAGLPYWVLPLLVSLAVQLWGLGEAAYSRDETATLAAAERPFDALVRMLHNVDVVHGTYYAGIWLVVKVAGPGPFATRLPSAVATAVTAAAVFGLGKRLVSPRAGLAAGLVFAVIPLASYWGQTARPFAIETALAAITSYLLVRALQAAAASGRSCYWWMAAYAVSLTALGLIQFLGLMLAVAHLVPVLRTWLRHRADGRGWRLAAAWLAAAVAAFALVSPVIGEGIAQRGFGKDPVNAAFFRSLLGLIGTIRMAELAGLAILCALAVSGFRGRARPRADWPGDLIALSVPWLILPAALLVLGTHGTTPLYNRYLVFCAPAAALLLGAALAALGWVAGTAVLAIFVTLAVPTLRLWRTPNGHGGADIVAADQVIARDMRPGDKLAYVAIAETIQLAYPEGMRQLQNIELGESAIRSATLGGLRAQRQVIERRARAAHRIWLVEVTANGGFDTRFTAIPPRLGFRKARTWDFSTLRLILYVRG